LASAVQPLDRPRAPSARLAKALYESHYLTAADPAGGRALWLRHTALKAPGEPARATVWVTWFDRAAPGPRALRVTAPDPLMDPGQDWARSELGRFGPGSATGEMEGARWELGWESATAPLPYLPANWLYDRPFPRSGGVALAPRAVLGGRLELEGVGQVELGAWEGMIGHNWGVDHPDEWVWLHAGGLGDDGRDWLDLILVRLRLGGRLTPWLASGGMELDGGRQKTARLGRAMFEEQGERGRATVRLAGGGRLALDTLAPEPATVQWDYASPAGPARTVRHCSVADGEIAIELGAERRSLSVAGRLAFEHGRR
jgi:hypothetical protein